MYKAFVHAFPRLYVMLFRNSRKEILLLKILVIKLKLLKLKLQVDRALKLSGNG